MRCAFYVADRARGALRHVVGIFAPCAKCAPFFQIGADAPGCGLSAFTGQPVISPDVREDPRWAPWQWLAERHGFRARWSFAVETAAGWIVGVFAMYFASGRMPVTEIQRDKTHRNDRMCGNVIGRIFRACWSAACGARRGGGQGVLTRRPRGRGLARRV
ncbi:GAF domain-containing protein [Falsiroseomonas tokyonensis]|uniref:GAF domain-containing protein n=1 Tax=Falsiroseomonas tokyonensis TaxID=430521 RepID=A0ABV7BX63_9PROT